MLEQPAPEGVHLVERARTGAAHEEQPRGRSHAGEVYVELSPMMGDSTLQQGKHSSP